jgi:hypothetical protein
VNKEKGTILTFIFGSESKADNGRILDRNWGRLKNGSQLLILFCNSGLKADNGRIFDSKSHLLP